MYTLTLCIPFNHLINLLCTPYVNLLVSPMYTRPQLQGILYITLDFESMKSMGLYLSLWSACLVRVFTVVNIVLMSYFLHTLLRSSPTPLT